MGHIAEETLAILQQERAETLRALLFVEESDCRLPAEEAGRMRTVNFLLRHYTSHTLDHYQQLLKLLRSRGQALTEPQMLLLKANAMLGEFEALALSFSDEDFAQPGPGEEWSPKQIVEHVVEIERLYRGRIVEAVQEAHPSATG